MAKIRLQSETLYTIEVNDAGETISFDVGEGDFYNKVQTMLDMQQKEVDNLDKRQIEIEKLSNETKGDELISEQKKAFLDSMNLFYKGSREAVDEFLGEGSCQKIFGDSNYITMFDDLFTAIEPEMKKAGVKFEKMMKKTRQKYAPQDRKKKVVL